MKVSIKQLEFPSSIKDKILKLKDISKLHIDFIGGKYIHFENTNLTIHEPHQIIISNNYLSFPVLFLKDINAIPTVKTSKSASWILF